MTVSPPALRASGSDVSSTQAVSLPSIDALHAQPGRERDLPDRHGRHIGEIERHHAEAAGLQDQIQRLQRAIDRAVGRTGRPEGPALPVMS